ncbi:peptidase M56 family protein [Specibacter cremeus]|uniref:peptidase M56 family protein n=1 Tax=Specibacter cremeus TaxID=1629051 RepID=UPI000F77B79F|nr:peptidase M56 family protein [Specibacter cremeus]
MNQPRLDEGFSDALRAALVSRVEESATVKRKRRRRLWLGAGIFVGAGLLGGVGAVPAGATNVVLELTCLTPGRFDFEDGASVSCTAADVGSAGAGYSVGLVPGQHMVTIHTEPGTRWRLAATYVNQATTAWGVNVNGESYGVQNEHGVPDLVAVVASNGRNGYVRRSEMEDADGTTAAKGFKSPDDAIAWQDARRGRSFPIPVYAADGKTVIGEFIIGGQ